MEEKEKFNQSKYNYQWAQENYYRLTVLVNAFVNRAIAEAMERDAARLDAQQAAEPEALAHAHKLQAVFCLGRIVSASVGGLFALLLFILQ